MADLSPKIRFHDDEKLKLVNPETIKLWKKYEIDMSLRNLSQATVDGYRNDIEHLFIYAYDNFGNPPISELTEDDLTEFFYFCKTSGNNTKRIKRRMSTVSAFYKFLRKKKLIAENPMEFIDRPTKDDSVITQTFLTSEQVADLKIKLKEAYENANTVNMKHLTLEQWTYALFSLSTMARINAVSNTSWAQVDFENRTVKDVLEKEGKIVDLYFSEEVKDLLIKLKDFRGENSIEDEGWVFLAKDDSGYHKASKGSLSQWCKRIGELIGVPSLHAHDFRHTSSNLLKKADVPLEDIATLLHHNSTETTVKHYLKKDDSKAVAIKDRLGI